MLQDNLMLACQKIPHNYRTFERVDVSLTLPASSVALIIIDMQNAYCSKGSLLDHWNANLDLAKPAINATARVAEVCRSNHIRVIYTQHCHRADLSDQDRAFREFRGRGSVEMESGLRALSSKLPIKGSWHAAIVDELEPREGDIIVDNKHTYTAFYQTDLEGILRNIGAETLLFTGATASICLESSLRDAFFRGFRCVLLTDCTYEKVKEMQMATELNVATFFGYVSTSEDVVRGLEHNQRSELS